MRAALATLWPCLLRVYATPQSWMRLSFYDAIQLLSDAFPLPLFPGRL